MAACRLGLRRKTDFGRFVARSLAEQSIVIVLTVERKRRANIDLRTDNYIIL